MTFRFAEMPSSGNLETNPPSLQLKYFATGSSDQAYVAAFAAGATPSITATPQGVLYRQNISLSWESSAYCVVTANYGPTDKTLGSYEVSFDTAGGTVHITGSKDTVGLYPAGQAPDMGGAIGVNGDDVDGTDIVVPALKLTVSFRHPAGVITLPQVKTMARHTAYVNDDEFLTFAPGEVLFLGASGRWGPGTETSLQYQFACSENADGDKKLTFGDIANVVKQGHDYCWIRFKDEVVGGKPVKVPKYAYVERVYSRVDFAPLFGFGG